MLDKWTRLDSVFGKRKKKKKQKAIIEWIFRALCRHTLVAELPERRGWIDEGCARAVDVCTLGDARVPAQRASRSQMLRTKLLDI